MKNVTVKRFSVITLAAVVLLGACACGAGTIKTGDDVGGGLERISKGMEQFSALKNGTLEMKSSLKSKSGAVESLDNGGAEGTTRTIFVRNPRGYDYIEETAFPDMKTGKTFYSAIKQVQGILYHSSSDDPVDEGRAGPYEWLELEEKDGDGYNPSAALKMMMSPGRLIREKEYVKSIAEERDGALKKFTVTANEKYAKYMKEQAHSLGEDYTVHEHRETYWIDENGLLIRFRNFDKFDQTIGGVPDAYTLDFAAELTGYNDKELKEISDKLL